MIGVDDLPADKELGGEEDGGDGDEGEEEGEHVAAFAVGPPHEKGAGGNENVGPKGHEGLEVADGEGAFAGAVDKKSGGVKKENQKDEDDVDHCDS